MVGTIGERIARARKRRGWTQEELAQSLGKKGLQISNWEQNRNIPKVQSLMALAYALEVSLQWLWIGQPELETPDSTNIRTTIADRIARARSIPGWNQATLAYWIRVSPSKVALWEAGLRKPRLKFLYRIAEATGVKLGWLRWGEGEKPKLPDLDFSGNPPADDPDPRATPSTRSGPGACPTSDGPIKAAGLPVPFSPSTNPNDTRSQDA